MDSKQIKKNRLDLEYNKHLQILNAVFIFLTTGLLGFLGSFIFLLEDKNKLLLGTGISVIVIIIGIIIYKKTNKKLEEVLEKIEKI